MTETLLELRDVVKEYSVTSSVLQRKVGAVHAVSGVSLSVPAGGTFGLVGESGCGKTTVGRMIVGLERPTSGEVVFAGRDISRPAFRERRRLQRERQFVFQDPYASLDPRMRVGAIVGEPLAVQRIGARAERRATVRRLLDEVGLPRDAVNRYPHDLTVVRYISDLIGVMYLGKLVEVGQAADIYERAAHPYTAALIATIPLPDPRHERSKSHASIRGELPSAIEPPAGCRFHTRCPLAQELCRSVEPPLRPFGASHVAACHFPLQQPLEGGQAA